GIARGHSMLSGRVSGVVSMSTGCGRERSFRRCPGMWRRTAGKAISPARSSSNSQPRQTTSRSAPLACFHPRASHNWRDSFQRLLPGIYEREGAAIYNTAVLIDRAGNVVGKYRKVYLPREEVEGGL